MVTYDPLRVAAFAAFLTLALEHLPGLLASLWRRGVVKMLKRLITRFYLRTSAGRTQLEEGERKIRAKIEKMLLKDVDEPVHSLPSLGLPKAEIIDRMRRLGSRDMKIWGTGKVSGGVYGHKEEHLSFLSEAMRPYLLANPLHPELFPGVRQMESEIVRMTAELFHGDAEVSGTLTTGGTESLLMMMFAYRQWGLKERGITSPEIVAPRTAHAALSKGGVYFGIKVIYVDVNPFTFEADLAAVEKAVSSNTVAIVGSVPTFPHGAIDPIPELSELALRKKVNLHVDCCLGGFLVPFMTEAGYDVPRFDFLVPGVTSISCDPHKYGCTPKGVSVILYRNPELRRMQYFMEMSWPGGLYFTPTMCGSKSGLLVTAAWASLMYHGRAGYVQNAKSILSCTRRITERVVREVPELYVMGTAPVSVVALGARNIGIFDVGEVMQHQKGWVLNSLQEPRGFHLCVTNANCLMGDQFVEDLKFAVETVKRMPDPPQVDAAVIYGMAEVLPDRSYMSFIGDAYLDTLYKA